MTRFPLLWIFVLSIGFTAQAQKYHNYVKELSDKGRWKQHVDYTMEVDVDVENYQYVGKQTLEYTKLQIRYIEYFIICISTHFSQIAK